MLLNLLINAEQAMLTAHGRGPLVVRTWHDSERDAVVFEVRDDGPGIAEERAAGKFSIRSSPPRRSARGRASGSRVAYGIVQEHGGRIWLSSQSGAGASFFVELPVRGASAAPATAGTETISLDAFKGLRVLVVDDEAALGAAVAEALGDAGFVVDARGRRRRSALRRDRERL